MEFIVERLGTAPKDREGADRSATEYTCPDIFGLRAVGSSALAETASIGMEPPSTGDEQAAHQETGGTNGSQA